MKISVEMAQALVTGLTAKITEAQQAGATSFDFDLTDALFLADDQARAELEQAISDAGK